MYSSVYFFFIIIIALLLSVCLSQARFFFLSLHCIPASISVSFFLFAKRLARRKIVNQNYQLDVTTLSNKTSLSPSLNFSQPIE